MLGGHFSSSRSFPKSFLKIFQEPPLNMIKSLASFAFNTTKRCAEIVEPFTPTFVKSRVVKVVAFAEKLVEKPYQTSKE